MANERQEPPPRTEDDLAHDILLRLGVETSNVYPDEHVARRVLGADWREWFGPYGNKVKRKVWMAIHPDKCGQHCTERFTAFMNLWDWAVRHQREK